MLRLRFDLQTGKNRPSSLIKQRVAIMSRRGRNASLVAMDPSTGEVKALGCVDWNNRDFSRYGHPRASL